MTAQIALIVSAFGTILFAIMGAMAISAIPDPNREIINAMPNTTPDIKTPANQALDAIDAANSLEYTATLWRGLTVFILLIVVPIGVIGGLYFGFR